MTLESLCASLDLSRQLKEAGCPQESLYYWICYPPEIWGIVSDANADLDMSQLYRCSAYTAEELLWLLPSKYGGKRIQSNNTTQGWEIGYPRMKVWCQDPSLASACAKLYLALKEKGLIGCQEPPADAYTAVMGLVELGERYGVQGPHDLSENHDDYLYGDKEDHQP